jgi:hypothetical protein
LEVSNDGWVLGDVVEIEDSDNAERRTVTEFGSLILDVALENGYQAGATVSVARGPASCAAARSSQKNSCKGSYNEFFDASQTCAGLVCDDATDFGDHTTSCCACPRPTCSGAEMFDEAKNPCACVPNPWFCPADAGGSFGYE